MSMDVGGGKGGPKSDINVTPLVDVMLVLLIIMMIVAPLLQQGVSLKLPTAANSGEKPETQDQTVLAIDASKRYYVNAKEVAKSEMQRRVQEILDTKSQKIVIIKADDDVEYGAVMEAMDALRAAGVVDAVGARVLGRRRSGLVNGAELGFGVVRRRLLVVARRHLHEHISRAHAARGGKEPSVVAVEGRDFVGRRLRAVVRGGDEGGLVVEAQILAEPEEAGHPCLTLDRAPRFLPIRSRAVPCRPSRSGPCPAAPSRDASSCRCRPIP